MREFGVILKRYGIWNPAALFLMAASPVKWTSPFGCAFLAAAGAAGIPLFSVAPGALLGAILGKGGLAGAAGGLGAYFISGFFREKENARAAVSLIALLSCLIPSVIYHIAGGTYDLIVSALSALAAMAACPVMMPFVSEGIFSRLQPDTEERIAFFLITAVCLSGITMLVPPAGAFLAGLFALMTAYGGVTSALTGALVSGVGLLLGGGDALIITVLFLCSPAAGVLFQKGAFLQSVLFLTGLPLCVYFDIGRESVYMLSAAAVYPWIPRAYKACFLRYAGLFNEKTHVYLSAACARRHAPPSGNKICGDAGCVERLSGGQMLFMLADGMGTGENAKKIAVRALESAKSVFRAPLSDSEALKCVNALCREKDSEIHTTIDICLMDLVTGRVKFLKNGAEPAWILGKRGVIRLEGEALPLGVLDEAPSSVKTEMVEPGDMIFMATDGLIHALGGADSAECALIQMKELSASALCAEIMKKARAAGEPLKRDDMSVLCARIYLKNPTERQRRFLPVPPEEIRKAG